MNTFCYGDKSALITNHLNHLFHFYNITNEYCIEKLCLNTHLIHESKTHYAQSHRDYKWKNIRLQHQARYIS